MNSNLVNLEDALSRFREFEPKLEGVSKAEIDSWPESRFGQFMVDFMMFTKFDAIDSLTRGTAPNDYHDIREAAFYKGRISLVNDFINTIENQKNKLKEPKNEE